MRASARKMAHAAPSFALPLLFRTEFMANSPRTAQPAKLPPAIAAVLADAKARVQASLGEHFVEMRLFGSYARGTAGPDSDIDVLVILDHAPGGGAAWKAAVDAVLDAGFSAELPMGPMVLGVKDLQHRRDCQTLLAHALDVEGITV